MSAQEQLVLDVRNLRVTISSPTRGVVRPVDGVSFRVCRGETLGIVGESASGKSMTALGIMRLQPPNAQVEAEQIWFEGQDLVRLTQQQMRRLRGRRIAMIPQDPTTSLNPAFTMGDQLSEPLALHRRLRGAVLRDEVIAALRRVKVPAPEHRVHQFPHQLSGGMRQRVVGAIAFSCNPVLLIADEPTTALDVTIQHQILRLLKELQRQIGVGLIFITHDLSLAWRMCDRVAVMYAGRIVETGPVGDLFANPRHPYTAALLACLPTRDSVERLGAIEGSPPDPAAFPSGCRFAPRCSRAEDACRVKYPEETQLKRDRSFSCFLPMRT